MTTLALAGVLRMVGAPRWQLAGNTGTDMPNDYLRMIIALSPLTQPSSRLSLGHELSCDARRHAVK